MRRQRLKAAALVACYSLLAGSAAAIGAAKQPFTVRDEIRIAYFGDPNRSETAAITLSPNQRLAAVHTTRGILIKNRMADEVRIYDLTRLKAWLEGPRTAAPPNPLRTFRLSTCDEGPIITDIRWLRGSLGIAFLAKTASGNEQLWTANIKTGLQHALTQPDQSVQSYDIRDDEHFVYAIPNPSKSSKALAAKLAGKMPIWVANTNLETLLAANVAKALPSQREMLWAARGSTPQPVLDPISKAPIVVYFTQLFRYRLSPDGHTALVSLPLPKAPAGWDQLYGHGATRIANRAGPQDLSSDEGDSYVMSYVMIDLASGAQTWLGSGPTAISEGWDALPAPSWSADGTHVLLPGAFVSKTSNAPCFAVASAMNGPDDCLTAVPANEFTDFVRRMGFEDGRSDRAWIERCRPVNSICANNSYRRVHYRQTAGQWRLVGETPISLDDATSAELGLRLMVKQGLNAPPVLWASLADGSTARPVWDPNPQLKDAELGQAKIFHWTDASGKSWRGGLYLPPDYKPGTRHPLVIQTHGFGPDQFRPSGAWPEGYAARELAAAGIVVLQVTDCPNVYSGDKDEAICPEIMYKAAVEQLDEDRVIDPARVGITGFSRTCIYVLDLLGKRTFPVRAALATDGVNDGYFQYVLGAQSSAIRSDAEKLIGSHPWGAGLQTWINRSPEFHLDKVQAPLLLIAAQPGFSLLTMWEPYGLLIAMHKPVDLLMLNTDSHPTWQPAARYASQQGAVDWFRFWLQSYEDPDPAKAAQYARWRKLRAEASGGSHP